MAEALDRPVRHHFLPLEFPRDLDGPPVVLEVILYLTHYDGDGEGQELCASLRVELVYSLDKTHRADLHQVLNSHAGVPVLVTESVDHSGRCLSTRRVRNFGAAARRRAQVGFPISGEAPAGVTFFARFGLTTLDARARVPLRSSGLVAAYR